MKQFLLLGFVCIILGTFASCEKEVPSEDVENGTFMRAIPKPGLQYNFYMYPTDDNGAILLSTDETHHPMNEVLTITKIDANGKVVWERPYYDLKLGFFISVRQPDGGVLIISDATDGLIVKIDKDGQVVNVIRVWYRDLDYTRYNSWPIQCSDGKMRMSTSSGSMGFAGKHTVYTFDQEGNILDFYPITDTSFRAKFKILYLGLFDYEPDNTFYFCGWCFTPENWQWSDKRKIFLAKQSYDFNRNLTYNKLVILDSALDDNDGFSLFQFITSDKKLLVVSGVDDKNTMPKAYVVKANSQLEIEWKKEINVTPYGTVPEGINELADGSYLLYGSCRYTTARDQPFACKLDKAGNIIWSKVFTLNNVGLFTGCASTADGNLLFSGYTTSFGKGSSSTDIFTLRTKPNGDYQ